VPTVVFAGLGDPIAKPRTIATPARKFDGDYLVEEVDGGHFMHREYPDAFAEAALGSFVIGAPLRPAAIVLCLCPRWIVAP